LARRDPEVTELKLTPENRRLIRQAFVRSWGTSMLRIMVRETVVLDDDGAEVAVLNTLGREVFSGGVDFKPWGKMTSVPCDENGDSEITVCAAAQALPGEPIDEQEGDEPESVVFQDGKPFVAFDTHFFTWVIVDTRDDKIIAVYRDRHAVKTREVFARDSKGRVKRDSWGSKVTKRRTRTLSLFAEDSAKEQCEALNSREPDKRFQAFPAPPNAFAGMLFTIESNGSRKVVNFQSDATREAARRFAA
jgi:hypothetical protein